MNDIFELSKNKVIITAEIGINHNGDLDLIFKMIDKAKESGVDAVKFQAYKTEHMYSRYTPGFSHTESNIFEQLKNYEIKDEWWKEIKDYVKSKELFFSTSIFDKYSLEIIKNIGVDFVKVASSEINNLPFIKEQIPLSDIFVISTGMSYLDEITDIIEFLRKNKIEKIFVLECTSIYPAPYESVFLKNIEFFKNIFSLPSGFSDHTRGIAHSIAAVGMGARFIEKHFTLDKIMKGPDHKLSSDPEEMKLLVKSIRDVEKSLKNNNKLSITNQENESRKIARKSMIAIKDLKKGDIISEENTVFKRPGLGIQIKEFKLVKGKKLKRDIKQDMWIKWEDIE